MANITNKKLLVQSAIVLAMAVSPMAAQAADHVTSTAETTVVTAVANDDDLVVVSGGTLQVTGGTAFDSDTYTNVGVNVAASSSSVESIKSTGDFTTIDFSDASTTVASITVTSGIVTGAATTGGKGAIVISGAADSYTISTGASGSITNSGAGGDAIVISGANGNQTATITNAGTISTTNNAGSIAIDLTDASGGSSVTLTNTGTLNAGALGTAINVGTGGNALTISSNTGTITGAITAAGASTITVTSNTGAIAGNITTATGALSLTQGTGGSVTGNIATTSGDADITLNGTSTVVGNIDLGTNASSTLVLNGTSSVTGNVNLDDVAQLLTFNGGTITGNVTAGTNGDGDIAVTASTVTNGDIGTNANQVDDITVSASMTLNADTNDGDIYADDITLGSGAVLTIGSGAFDADVLGSADGNGTFNINDSLTVAAGNTIGTAAASLAAINIAAGKTVDADANNNQFHAVATSIGSGSTLKLGSGTISGTIDGASSGVGTLRFGDNVSTDGNIGATNKLASIVIADGATVDADTNDNQIKATAITLGTGAAGTATLTLGTGAIAGTIDGDAAGAGVLNFNGNNSTTANIGSTNKLATINVGAGFTVTGAHNLAASDVNVNGVLNQSAGTIGATSATIDVESTGTLTLSGTGDFTGTIDGNDAAEGTVNLNRDFTTSSTKVLGDADGLGALNVKTARTLTLGGNIKATTTTVEGTGAIAFGGTNRTVTGDLTFANGGSTANLGTGSHTVSGTLTLGAADIVATTISATTSGAISTFGNFASVGTISNNAGVDVDVTLNSDVGFIADGDVFELITGTGATDLTSDSSQISINGGDNATGLLTFNASVSSGDLVVTVTRADMEDVATNSNADAVGAALDSIGFSGGTNLDTIQSQLQVAETASSITGTLDSLTAQSDNSLSQGSFDIAKQSAGTVDARLGSLRSGASAGAIPAGTGVWVQGFGSQTEQDSSGGIAGYDADTYGVALGADRKLANGVTIGLAATYANSEIDSKNTAKSTDVDAYQVNLYATKEYGKFYADGLLGFAYNQYDSSRYISAIPATATADFNGQTYTAKVGGGYTYKVPNSGLEIVPNASLTYALNTVENYSEAGAGALNLSVDTEDSSLLQGKVGANIGYAVNTNGAKVRPELRAAVGYDFIGDNQVSTSNFTGVPTTFNTEGAEIEKTSYNLGAGVDVASKNGYTVSADYDFEGKSNYTSHAGVLRVRYDF